MKRLLLAFFILSVFLTAQSARARGVEIWSLNATTNRFAHDFQAQYAPMFAKATGINVTFKAYDKNTVQEAFQRIANNDGPDVVIGPIDQTFLLPLNKLMERWDDRKFIADKMIVKDGATRNIFALPLGVDITGIGYFKSYFSQAGFNPDKPPATWDELARAAAKLTNKSSIALRAGFDCYWNEGPFAYFLLQNGGSMVSADGRRSELKSPAALQTVEFMAHLFQTTREYTKLEIAAYNFKFPLESAMRWGNAYVIQPVADIMNGNAIAGAFTTKSCTSCPNTTIGNPYMTIGIPRCSRDAQAAWALITWLLSPDINVAINVGAFILPSRIDVAAKVAARAPALADWYKLLPYAELSFWYSYSAREKTALNDLIYAKADSMFRQVLRGEIDADLFLAKLQVDHQAALDADWMERR